MSADARAYALRLLGQRSYTSHALRKKLLRKEFRAGEIDAVLERFTESGLLDDARFALNFTRARLTGTSASPRRIRQALSLKGIPTAMANAAIEQVIVEEAIDVTVALERVARKKLSSLAGLDSITQRRRLFGYLFRRGYDLDEVRSTVERCMSRDSCA